MLAVRNDPVDAQVVPLLRDLKKLFVGAVKLPTVTKDPSEDATKGPVPDAPKEDTFVQVTPSVLPMFVMKLVPVSPKTETYLIPS
jgi:hypothetical protein